MEIIYLILCLSAGFAVGYLLFRNQSSASIADMFSQKNVAEEKASALLLQKQKLENDSEKQRQEILQLTSENSSVKKSFENLQQKLAEQKQEVEQMQERMKADFRNLANDLLEEKSKKFTEQNKTNLDEILTPLKEKIKDFEKRVEDSHKDSIMKNAGLKQQIEDLQKLNQTIGEEAKNLTRALKGQTKAQGNWGERILENILEVSGLEKNREYTFQLNAYNEEGRRFIPDVIIKLPDGKNLVIDSKVSIIAYENYCNAPDVLAQRKFLAEHVTSVKNHVRQLSVKAYQQLYQLNTLDFVLMFVPIDAAYALVVQEDGALWTQAFEKNVLIVTPLSMLPALRTVANIWRQEKQDRFALEIAQVGGELYDKFAALMEDLKIIRNRMQQTQNAFDQSLKKLQGRENLIKKVEKLKELGATASKQLPKNLLDWADAET